MQVHAVPLEERAINSKGERLPWAIDHLDEGLNSRRPTQEWGPFGRGGRRKGSTRASRTATPAKKDNPDLDGFAQALKYDQERASVEGQRQGQASSSGAPSNPLASIDGNAGTRKSLVVQKEPTQVMLYGYSENTQWAALEHYEKVSGGLICEDYERAPPYDRRRFHSALAGNAYVHSRPLTRAERAMASQFHGGKCWIKVTFDSAEAADRAVYNSPHLIQGHWVHAELFYGQAPANDEPILYLPQDRQPGLLGDPKSFQRPTQTLGPSFSMLSANEPPPRPRATATLPRSFTSNAIAPARDQTPSESSTVSSATASSATATGPSYPDLRQRLPPTDEENKSPAISASRTNQSQPNPRTFTHFPDLPKTVLRPASEAFMPQPTWSQRMSTQYPITRWLSTDVIGTVVPRLENGDFDWNAASFYWKICYWLDTHLGTDLCGMKED